MGLPVVISQIKILIVEENPSVREQLLMITGQDSGKVILCRTEKEALSQVKKSHFNIIFINLNLTESAGLKLIRQIDKLARVPKLIVWICENTVVDSDRGHIIHLREPVNRVNLIPIIYKAFLVNCTLCNEQFTNEIELREWMARKFRYQIDELRYMDEINKAYLKGIPSKDFLKLAYTTFRKLFGKGHLSLYSYDHEFKRLKREHISLTQNIQNKIEKLTGVKISEITPTLDENSLFGGILASGKGHFTSDRHEIEKILGEFKTNKDQEKYISTVIKILGIKFYGIIPLIANGKTIGMIVFFKKDKLYSMEEIERLERFSKQIAIFLEKIKQNELLKYQQEDLNFLHSLSLALIRGDSIDQIQNFCQKRLKKLFKCTASQIYLYDEATESLLLKNLNLSKYARKKIEDLIGFKLKNIHVPLMPDNLYTKIFRNGRVHVTTELSTIYRLMEEFIPSIAPTGTAKFQFLKGLIPQIANMHKIRTTASFPLVYENVKAGLYDVHRDFPFSSEEVRRLKWIARGITAIISKRKDELALSDSERKKEALLSIIPDLIFLVDHQGRFLDYHGNGISELYAKPEEFLGKPLTSILPEKIAQPAMTAIKKVLKNRDRENIEYTLILNGHKRYYWAHMAYFDTKKVLILSRDITKYKLMELELRNSGTQLEKRIEERTSTLKRAMESLRESREKYFSLFSNAHDMINIMNTNGTILDANSSELNTLGYEREDYLGRSYLDIVHPDYVDRTREYLRNVCHNNHREIFETCLRTQNGRNVYVEVIITPQFKNNKIDSLRTISRNTTERHKAEQRAITISEEEQRRLGRELHDGIGQDLTGIALLTKALEKKIPEDRRDILDDLQNIIDIANGTREKIKSLSRGLYPARLEISGLETVLLELATNTENLHNIHCQLECEPLSGIKKSDEIHIYRIIKEAVANAVKHAHAKEIKITCMDNNNQLIFSISDDGLGLDATQRQSEGLGLFIMQNRAKMINARLSIQNGKNGGTIVKFYLRKKGMNHDG